MKIGVTSDANEYVRGSLSGIPTHLLQVIEKNDITPIAIPIVSSQEAVQLISEVDGLIIKGGTDVNPARYNQTALPTTDPADNKKDSSEFAAIKAALSQEKPILGICRGMQAINVMFGGTLYQDIYRQHPNADKLTNHTADWEHGYFPTHDVLTEPQTLIRGELGEQALINSRHHQAVHQIGDGLIVGAYSKDGIIEEIESIDGMVQGLQWHPEDIWKGDPKEEQIFVNFFNRVKDAKSINN